jgi:hypothetical protein
MFLTYMISLNVRTADIPASLVFVLGKTKLAQSECKYSSIIRFADGIGIFSYMQPFLLTCR